MAGIEFPRHGLAAATGQLIRPRRDDRFEQELEVKPTGHKRAGQFVQQLGVVGYGLLAADHLVDRFHQPFAEEVRPYPVHRGFGEVRVFRTRYPVRQCFARGVRRHSLRFSAVRESRRSLAVGAGNGNLPHVQFFGFGHSQPIPLIPAFHSAEERREAPKLVALPLGERVVMALGALQADAQEHAGRCRG